MEHPPKISPELALFIADSTDVTNQLEQINQKLLANLETLPELLDCVPDPIGQPQHIFIEQKVLEDSGNE